MALEPTPVGGEFPGHKHAHEGSGLSDVTLRVRALESLLIEKGYVDPAAPMRRRSAHATARGSSREAGSTRPIAAGCSTTPPRR